MRRVPVGSVVKEAADLWAQHLLRLLPFSAAAYAAGVAAYFAVSEGVARLPFIANHPPLADDATVLEGLSAALTWLAAPALGVFLGGALVTFFWAACCRIALDQVTIPAAIRAMGQDTRVAVRFVMAAAITLFLALIPLAAATVIGGVAGRVVLVIGLIALIWLLPYWMLLVPLSQRDQGPFLRRFNQLVVKQARAGLFLLGGLVLLISVLVSIPAALAVTLDARPLLVGCVLVPFHAALAPMQAFIQARAYAQLVS